MKEDKDLKFLIKVIRILHSKISNLESKLEEAEEENEILLKIINNSEKIFKKLIEVREQ